MFEVFGSLGFKKQNLDFTFCLLCDGCMGGGVFHILINVHLFQGIFVFKLQGRVITLRYIRYLITLKQTCVTQGIVNVSL